MGSPSEMDDEANENRVIGILTRLGRLSMRAKLTTLFSVWTISMLIILSTNLPHLVAYLEGSAPQRQSEEELGVEFTARMVGDVSTAGSPILIELVCHNILLTDSVTVSPFPEWGYNPGFLLQTPGGRSFRSWNSRYGPPPTTQRSNLAPGGEVSKIFNLLDLPSTGWWAEEGWTETDQWHRGADVFSEPGSYNLTVVYRPFYHLYFTNETRAGITMNATLTFNRPRAPLVAHLGGSDLSFLGPDLGSIVLEAGLGPYQAIGPVLDSYDVVILDNVPPEWIGNATEAFMRAVVDRGLRIVMFGGPNSLGGNGTYSSWCDGPLGSLLPVKCGGVYREVASGYRVEKIGQLSASLRDEALEGLDTSSLDTVRHLNPCYMREGAYLVYMLAWQGAEPEFFLAQWEIGKGDVIVCPAALEEILAWEQGRDLVSRIVKAAVLPG